MCLALYINDVILCMHYKKPMRKDFTGEKNPRFKGIKRLSPEVTYLIWTCWYRFHQEVPILFCSFTAEGYFKHDSSWSELYFKLQTLKCRQSNESAI